MENRQTGRQGKQAGRQTGMVHEVSGGDSCPVRLGSALWAQFRFIPGWSYRLTAHTTTTTFSRLLDGISHQDNVVITVGRKPRLNNANNSDPCQLHSDINL